MDKKTAVLMGTVLTIILGIVGSLIAWFCGGNTLEEGPARNAIRKMFNFEITFIIVAILLGWIPLLGQLLVLGLWAANIAFAIKSYNAAIKDEEVNVWGFEFIK